MQHVRSLERRGAALLLAVAALASAPRAQDAATLFPDQVYPTTQADDVRLGDVDGDGALDIVVLGHGPSLTILRGAHHGELLPGPVPNDVPIGSDARSFGLGDLNSDGALDALVSYTSGNRLGALFGLGNGKFLGPLQIQLDSPTSTLALADFDGDGVLDYAVDTFPVSAVLVAFGTGDGGFGAPTSFATGGSGSGPLIVADVDQANGPDLIVGHEGSGDVAVLLNDGDGAFTLSHSAAVSVKPTALAAADWSGDGVLDLVVVCGFPSPIAERVALLQGAGDGSFGAPQYLPALGLLADRSVAAADLDADGDVDLVLGSSGDRIALVLQGPGGFVDAPQLRTVGQHPRSLALGDVTGDGLVDVVAATYTDMGVTVVAGDGSADFVRPPAVFASAGMPSAAAVADIDLDGHSDFLSLRLNDVGHTLSVQLGDGLGAMGAPLDTEVAHNADSSPDDLVVADFDLDGLPDVCLIDSSGDRVSVLLGAGDGSFTSQVDTLTLFDPTRLAVGDLNGDTLLDLVLLRKPEDDAVSMLALGGGAFAAPQPFDVGERPVDLLLHDLDGDGALDLLVASEGDNAVQVFHGAGDGGFALAQVLTVGADPSALALSDLDGDGLPDLLCSRTGLGFLQLAGSADGTFATTGTSSPGQFEFAADMNLDGLVDLVGVGELPSVTVILQRLGGGFDKPREYVVDAAFKIAWIGSGDFDADGVPDLLLSRPSDLILLGQTDPLWTRLGGGLAGSHGVPWLRGVGALTPDSAVTLELRFARANSTSALFAGVAQLGLPFKGGTLVPAPDLLRVGLPTDGDGAFTLSTSWPAGVPAGFELFLQQWVLDPEAPAGYAASDGLRATAQ